MKHDNCEDCKRPFMLCNCFDDEWIEDSNYEEPEEEESEITTLPPRIGKEDLSFKDLEELD